MQSSHADSIGGSKQIAAIGSYSDGTSNPVSSGVSWSSGDPRIVNISGSGLATGKATGTVAITAVYQGQTATALLSSSIGDVPWSAPLTITQEGTFPAIGRVSIREPRRSRLPRQSRY